MAASNLLPSPGGTILDVSIPPGTRDGQILRLKGKGRLAVGDGPPGDALMRSASWESDVRYNLR
jgi:DnaJ-class molecular chaperone